MNTTSGITPNIIKITKFEDGVEIELNIPSNLEYFNGHFNNQPVLPGVVQLDWAVKYAKQYLQFPVSIFKSMEVLKFQEIIIPNSNVLLTLNKLSQEKFKFSYTSENAQHSSARVVLQDA